jgi:hypothetical protein
LNPKKETAFKRRFSFFSGLLMVPFQTADVGKREKFEVRGNYLLAKARKSLLKQLLSS